MQAMRSLSLSLCRQAERFHSHWTGTRGEHSLFAVAARPLRSSPFVFLSLLSVAVAQAPQTEDALSFQQPILKSYGIGDETYVYRSIFSAGNCANVKEDCTETATVIFGASMSCSKNAESAPRASVSSSSTAASSTSLHFPSSAKLEFMSGEKLGEIFHHDSTIFDPFSVFSLRYGGPHAS